MGKKYKEIPRTLPLGRGKENRVKYVSGNSYEELCKRRTPGRALYAIFTIRLTHEEIAEDLKKHGRTESPDSMPAISMTKILHIGHPDDYRFAVERDLGDLRFFTIRIDQAQEWADLTA